MMVQEPVAWDCSPTSTPVDRRTHPTAREADSLSGFSHMISKATPVWDFIFSLKDLFMTSQLLGIPTPPNPWGAGQRGHCNSC